MDTSSRKRKRQHVAASVIQIVLIAAAACGVVFGVNAFNRNLPERNSGELPAASESNPAAEESAPATESSPHANVRFEPSSSDADSPAPAQVSPPAPPQASDQPVTAETPLDCCVPASDPVDSSYFDDAIFIGDSISTGIPLYHIADNAAVVAVTGINPDNINYKKCVDIGEEERVTVLEAAATHGARSKVYIMLGDNGIGYEKQSFISSYRLFVDSVKKLYPDAVIYLQSMTPVVEGYVNQFDPTMNNDKIDEYNRAIMELAEQESVYYLDVGSALKNKNGALPDEASPVDGLHFSAEYYQKWFDYLKTHTVSAGEVGESAEQTTTA